MRFDTNDVIARTSYYGLILFVALSFLFNQSFSIQLSYYAIPLASIFSLSFTYDDYKAWKHYHSRTKKEINYDKKWFEEHNQKDWRVEENFGIKTAFLFISIKFLSNTWRMFLFIQIAVFALYYIALIFLKIIDIIKQL